MAWLESAPRGERKQRVRGNVGLASPRQREARQQGGFYR